MGLLYITEKGERRSLSPQYYQQQIEAIEQQEAQKKLVAEQQAKIQAQTQPPPTPPLTGFPHAGGFTYADVAVYLGGAKIPEELTARVEQVHIAEKEMVIQAGISAFAFFVLPPLASKAWSALPQAVTTPIEKGLHGAKLWVQAKVPFWKLTQPFSTHLARGEMAIPTFERYGLAELEAESVAWGAMQTPRMGGVMLAREVGGEASKSGFQILVRDVLKGWIVKEATFTPLVSQSQVTRMGIQPYIPKGSTIGVGLSEFWKGAISVGATMLMQPQKLIPKAFQLEKPQQLKREVPIAIPKVFEPTLTFEREKFRPQQFFETLPKQKERAIPLLLPSLIPTVIPKQEPFLTPKQTPFQIPKQAPRQIPRLWLPTPPKPGQTPFPFIPPRVRLPSYGLPSFGGRGYTGKWFQKKHPIRTPESAAKLFGLPTTFKRRGKAKRVRMPHL
jgi:hypothetical protein